jgi:hypothetical protein
MRALSTEEDSTLASSDAPTRRLLERSLCARHDVHFAGSLVPILDPASPTIGRAAWRS